jgi:hypothetical protein
MHDPVAPASPILVGNLAALWRRDPKLAERIEPLLDEPAALEPTPTGPTLRHTTADGASVYLHSRRDPRGEAERLAHGIDLEKTEALFLLGLGLGHVALELFGRLAGRDLFLVEPSDRVFAAALGALDLRPLLTNNRVHWLVGGSRDAIGEKLNYHMPAIHLGYKVIEHAASVRSAPQRYAELRAAIDEAALHARTTINTVLLNGRRTAENIAANLGRYVDSPSIDSLKDRHAKKPAIIVSAGPSLAKNKHLLPGIADKAVVIAVQTTYRPLLEMGVVPHYVTSLDYHDICTRFFENLPPGGRSHLVAEPKATPKIFDLHDGPLTVNGNDLADGLLRGATPESDRLRGGATVAHLAFYLAEHLGCDPIIFVGQDLGFTGGLCYTPGTGYDSVWKPEINRFCTSEMKQWEQVVRDKPILCRVNDWDGVGMYTEARLFSYLKQFERDFAASDRTIIDATEGGVAKAHATRMALADAIASYCGASLSLDTSAGPTPRASRAAAAEALSRRVEEAERIADCSRRVLPLLERVRENVRDAAAANAIIVEIDAIRRQVDGLRETYELVLQLAQPGELRRFAADRRMNDDEAITPEKQERQIARDLDNVRSVLEGAERLAALAAAARDTLMPAPHDARRAA